MKFMKHSRTMLLAVGMMAMVLTACGSQETKKPEDTTTLVRRVLLMISIYYHCIMLIEREPKESSTEDLVVGHDQVKQKKSPWR